MLGCECGTELKYSVWQKPTLSEQQGHSAAGQHGLFQHPVGLLCHLSSHIFSLHVYSISVHIVVHQSFNPPVKFFLKNMPHHNLYFSVSLVSLAYIEVTEAFEVILLQLCNAVVLQVKQFSVMGDVLRD